MYIYLVCVVSSTFSHNLDFIIKKTNPITKFYAVLVDQRRVIEEKLKLVQNELDEKYPATITDIKKLLAARDHFFNKYFFGKNAYVLQASFRIYCTNFIIKIISLLTVTFYI